MMIFPFTTLLVTGGTGFIGSALCEKLCLLGVCVYVLTRRDINSIKVNSTLLTGRITYINSLAEIEDIEIEGIINLAGETIAKRWSKAYQRSIYESRVFTTRQLIEYIERSRFKPRVLISGSAVGYYGASFDKVFNEESGEEGEVFQSFSRSLCQDWEREAKRASEFGVRVVLLRMGPVLASKGGLIQKLKGSFLMGLGSIIGSGMQWISWIDRDDLIELIIFSLVNSRIEGALNATAPCFVTNYDFSVTLAKALKRPCLFKAPAFIFSLLFGQMAKELMLEGQKVFPQKALREGFTFAFPELSLSLGKIISLKNNRHSI